MRRPQIKLGPPLFVPNSNIGTFGAISQIRSLIRSRADLFDVAFAGPAAAAAASAALFVTGLVLSSGGVPKARAVPCVDWMHLPDARLGRHHQFNALQIWSCCACRAVFLGGGLDARLIPPVQLCKQLLKLI